MASDDRPRRPSTAPTRTVLSWRRSGLSVVAAGLAIARGVPSIDGVPSRPVLGVVAIAMGLAAMAVSSGCGRRRARRMATDRPAAVVADLWPVAAVTVVVAVGAVVVVAVA